jgi:hypothetical protein
MRRTIARKVRLMTSASKAMTSYLIGSCIVWAGIFLAVAVMLPEHFAQLLPILAGPMVWFLILVPPLFRARSDGPSPDRNAEGPATDSP